MKQNIAPDGGFFQSHIWRDFQESLGKKVVETPHFFGVLGNVPVAGKYLYVPRGPVADAPGYSSIKEELGRIAKQENLSFIRIEPQERELLEFLQKEMSVTPAPSDVQPREILMLPIGALSSQELLQKMKSKVRYNVRLAEKKGVVVRPAKSEAEIEQFLDIVSATAERKNIRFHERAYYKKFITFFTQNGGALLLALHDDVVLAGNILTFFDETAYYVHGASSNSGRNMMAPHLLQYQSMLWAKERGAGRYDLGGVATQHQAPTGKDWSGITRFKQGFNEEAESLLLPGTIDVIFKPWRYKVYRLLRCIKK